MFVQEFCDEPEKAQLHESGKKYDYPFDKEFDAKLNNLDRFLFLVDMHKIIESCAEDLRESSLEDMDDFWKINKLLLNFANAVYSYKEYVNSYEPSLKPITESYYNKKGMYRFICDFRNYIIHQSVIIKDYNPSNKGLLIKIEDVTEQIGSYTYPKDWQKKNAEEFKTWIEKFKASSRIINGSHFLNMKDLVKQVMMELELLKGEVLLYAYNNGVKETLEWLLQQIPVVEDKYQYAFIVDKENLPSSVREPNYAYEDFIRRMIKALGKDSMVYAELCRLTTEKKYLFFYDGMCDLETFVKNSLE